MIKRVLTLAVVATASTLIWFVGTGSANSPDSDLKTTSYVGHFGATDPCTGATGNFTDNTTVSIDTDPNQVVVSVTYKVPSQGGFSAVLHGAATFGSWDAGASSYNVPLFGDVLKSKKVYAHAVFITSVSASSGQPTSDSIQAEANSCGS